MKNKKNFEKFLGCRKQPQSEKGGFQSLRHKKKGVSEIISYVILISITVGLAVAVYAVVQSIKITPEVNCEEGTTIYISDYTINPSELTLTIKNNGRFNVSGIILAISNNSQREPTLNLIPNDLAGATQQVKRDNAGIFYFMIALKPGEEQVAKFMNQDQKLLPINLDMTKVIQIQPFILGKKGRVVCKSSTIKQNV